MAGHSNFWTVMPECKLVELSAMRLLHVELLSIHDGPAAQVESRYFACTSVHKDLCFLPFYNLPV
jgi:hypothetical protein